MSLTAVIFSTLKICGMVGVNAEAETSGQDRSVHGEPGYVDEDDALLQPLTERNGIESESAEEEKWY